MPTILVIEDAHALRSDIVDVLSMEGYTLLEASDGAQGVALAEKQLPDLIVCDVMMPIMNGYDVLKTLRNQPLTTTIPFIFLTSVSDYDDQRRGMVLGADDYITKPFEVSELLATITTQLKKQHDLLLSANRHLDDLRLNIITALPHELRTPLNTILGFSELLMSDAVEVSPEQMRNWGKHIHSSGQRLLRIAENYLVYARISIALNNEDDLLRYRLETYAGGQTALITQAHQAALRHQREGLLEVMSEAAPALHICETDFLKIVDELVDNACKFSPVNSPVRVRGVLKPDHFAIHVQDEGRGLNAESVKRVGAYMQFDRWFYEQQGMGLGLAIVVQLLKLYDGTFQIVQPDGGGTEVIVRLRRVSTDTRL